ncbi:hypothetical protein TWF718_005040 [Orbilia javanica]|uniref:Uncharacterized protein n=1 Tax=Orbilia javanica TaxID=47235 RepID=A0AAN8RR27_9PEZI
MLSATPTSRDRRRSKRFNWTQNLTPLPETEKDTTEPPWPHLETLRERERLVKPTRLLFNNLSEDVDEGILGDITKKFGGQKDQKIDITVVQIKERPGGTDNCFIETQQHLSDETDCQNFLENLNSSPPDDNTKILLLVQDMSLAMINFLYGELHVPISTIISHVQGLQGSAEHILPRIFRAPYNASLYERLPDPDKTSVLSDILDYSLDSVAWKRRFIIENTSRFSLDWRSMMWQSKYLYDVEMSSLRKHSDSEKDFLVNWRMEDIVSPENPYDIGPMIYRPHQTISSEREREYLLRSGEERASWVSTKFGRHKIDVYFFDAPRYLIDSSHQHGSSDFETPTFERPKTRMETLRINDENRIFNTSREYFEGLLLHWSSQCKTLDDIEKCCQADFIKAKAIETSDTLTVIDAVIDTIEHKLAFSTKLEDEIELWEKKLSSFRPLLSQMAHLEETIQLYLNMMLRKSTPNATQSHTRDTTAEIVSKSLIIVKEVAKFRKHTATRVECTFQALMSSMSIIESKEAIKEASSVGKLTELAFIFIPLSFTATFYSMQIEALAPTITKFIILGTLLLFFSYLARLFINGRLSKKLKHAAKEPIYIARVVNRGSHIPFSTYMWFHLWHKKGKRLFITLLLFAPFMTIGILLVLKVSSTTAFKPIGCIIVFAYCINSVTPSLSLTRLDRLIFNLVFAFACGIAWSGFESQSERPIRIAIASASSTAFCYFTWVLLRAHPGLFGSIFILLMIPLILLPPSVLFLLPWSRQPQLEYWKAGLATIGSCIAALLVSVGVIYLTDLLLIFKKPKNSSFFISSSQVITFYFLVIFLLAIPGIPALLLWVHLGIQYKDSPNFLEMKMVFTAGFISFSILLMTAIFRKSLVNITTVPI